MIILKIDKPTLDGYRDYKIDLSEDKVEESYTYNVMEHMLKNGWKMQKFYDVLGDSEWVMVDVENGDVTDRSKEISPREMEKLLEQMEKSRSSWTTKDPTADPAKEKLGELDWSRFGKFRPKDSDSSNPYDIKF